MPSITIRETDNTVYGLSTVTSDNIVFIPGAAITGPSDKPTLLGSAEDFINKFGPYAPERGDNTIGSTWDYTYNLLLQGMPVLFKRITTKTESGGQITQLVKKAKADLKTSYLEGEESVDIVGTVTELYGGSYGNTLSFSIERLTNSIYFRVYRGTVLLETVRVINITDGETEDDIRKKLLEAVPLLDLKTVKIDITDEEKFVLAPATNIKLTGGEDADDTEVRKQIPLVYADLEDKLVYDVKFLTSGGYVDATSNDTPIANAMVSLAETRGDCIAILDIPIGLPKEEVTTFFATFNSSYATTYAPWQYTRLKDKTEKWMAPSFIFLYTLAKSLNSGNTLWSPPAGVKRASVPEITKAEYEIGKAILDQWQGNNPQYVNPIMKLRNYGYVIYGQRTLYSTVEGSNDKRSGLRELGVRITANEIKRKIFNVALSLTFDQNTIRTWNEFRAPLDTFLTQMKADRGITDYQINRDETVITDTDDNKIRGTVRVSITRAAEDFDINFDLQPQAVTFQEEDNSIGTIYDQVYS